jgi:ubiquinone biosynthesis protein COQ9
MSAGDDRRRDRLLEAILPDVPFDGWTRGVIAAAAARTDLDAAALFPNGPRDAVAWFGRWADAKTAAVLDANKLARLKIRERIALGVTTRLDILLPHREAVRRALTLLSMPRHLPLAARLLYGTVDTIWRAAGDTSTDFNFYSKRGLLAGVYAATTFYWLDDRSPNAEATVAFLDRRLAEVLAIPRLKDRLPRLPDPLRILRRFSAA